MTLFRSIGAALETDGSGTVPLDVRKDLAGLFTGVGVLPGAASPLVTGAATFAYTVGSAAWVTSRGASDGVHLWGNDGAVSVSQATWPLSLAGETLVAPGSGLKRIDIIYALHPSNNENADETSVPVIGVAKGQAQSIPIAPTLPAGALELARNEMTPSATSTASSGNAISQTAASAALIQAPVVNAETVVNPAVTTGSLSSSTRIAVYSVAAVDYDRVVECVGHVSSNGVVAGAVWTAVLSSQGTAISSATVEAEVRFPFSSTVALGGGATVVASFALPAGQTAVPSLWVRLLSGAGANTVASPSSFRVRMRPAVTR